MYSSILNCYESGSTVYLAQKHAKNEPNKIFIRLNSPEQLALGAGGDVIAPIFRLSFVIQPSSDKINR